MKVFTKLIRKIIKLFSKNKKGGTMSNFNKAFDITLGKEGGYVYDPVDRGGETLRGISRKYHPDWSGWKVVDKLKNRTDFPDCLDNNEELDSSVKSFYKKNYWDKLNLDYINSEKITSELFDTAVNQGCRSAGKYLQETLNILNRDGRNYADLAVDGIIGNNTLSVVNKYLPSYETAIWKCLNGFQFKRYYDIVKNDSRQERFMHGWLKRIF